MTERIKPPRLKPGARIGVVSPAYQLDRKRWSQAEAAFAERGYELVPGPCMDAREHRYAGSAAQRAAEIMALFGDDSVDAIICARGGYGGNRVLPLLDFGLIRAHPKIFVGFSDITGLLTSFAQRCGLVGFHGPMLSSFSGAADDYNFDVLEAVLSGADGVRIGSPPACRARTLRPGAARGPLWGGNLSLVIERLGTPGQIDTRGAILLLEEVGEPLHRFDRMLLQLRNAGCLDAIAGLVIGELVEMDEGGTPFGNSTDDIVLDVCAGLDFPIVSHFPCGHGDCQATLPISHEVELQATGAEPCILLPAAPVS